MSLPFFYLNIHGSLLTAREKNKVILSLKVRIEFYAFGLTKGVKHVHFIAQIIIVFNKEAISMDPVLFLLKCQQQLCKVSVSMLLKRKTGSGKRARRREK